MTNVFITGNGTINGGGLYLGFIAGGSGTYTLSNGTLALTNGAKEYIGYSGYGTFNQSGGTHTVGTTLYLEGIYNLGTPHEITYPNRG